MKLLLLTFVCVVQMSHFLNWKCGSPCQLTLPLPLPLTLTLTCGGASAEASSPWKSVTQAGVMREALMFCVSLLGRLEGRSIQLELSGVTNKTQQQPGSRWFLFGVGLIPAPPPLTSERSQLRSERLVVKRLHSRSAIQTVYSSTTPGRHGCAVNEPQMQGKGSELGAMTHRGPASTTGKLLLLLPLLLQASTSILAPSARAQ